MVLRVSKANLGCCQIRLWVYTFYVIWVYNTEIHNLKKILDWELGTLNFLILSLIQWIWDKSLPILSFSFFQLKWKGQTGALSICESFSSSQRNKGGTTEQLPDMSFHSHGNGSVWAQLASSSLSAAVGRRFQDFSEGPECWLISFFLLQLLNLS